MQIRSNRLILKLLFGLHAEQYDIETAFLEGNLDEEIYMLLPEGYADYLKEKHGCEINEDEYCLKLHMAIYGLVQAAWQWWKKFKGVLKSLGFEPSSVDPCLFIKPDVRLSLNTIYVDDGCMLGKKETIETVLHGLCKHFTVKHLGALKNYVGFQIEEKENKIIIKQPKLIAHLVKAFGKYVPNKEYVTPAVHRMIVMQPMEDDSVIEENQQNDFRTGVGMLLYLVKHSRPDIANSMQELTKVLDRATLAHWKAMLRVIKLRASYEKSRLNFKSKTG
jgi:hypothetical protein